MALFTPIAFSNSLNLADTDGDWRDGSVDSDITHGKDRVLYSLGTGATEEFEALHFYWGKARVSTNPL